MNPKRRAQRAKRKAAELERRRTFNQRAKREPDFKTGMFGERVPLTRRARIQQQNCEHEPGILCRDQHDNAWRLCEKCGTVVMFEGDGQL